MGKPQDIHLIENDEELFAINGTVSASTTAKKITRLEQHSRNILARSPFCLLATSSEDGTDVSPRGDAPGFVHCLDDTTLLIPERPGNRIADSLRNIISNPAIGLLFLIPGMNDTLRINGRAFITDHAPYLDRLAARGKTPKLAIVVDIEEVYLHCPKAFIRAALWDPASFMERSDMPTLGRMVLEQISGAPPDAETLAAVDKALEQDSTENLY